MGLITTPHQLPMLEQRCFHGLVGGTSCRSQLYRNNVKLQQFTTGFRDQSSFRGESAGRTSRCGNLVVCMAHPRRVAKVAKQIEREIGTLLLYDRVLQEAVCPEKVRGMDSALSALASVTEVCLTNDLQVAKVYISVFSDDQGKDLAMQRLMNLQGYVRKHIGRSIRLRLTPEIRFLRDDSIERGARVLKLLEQIKQEKLADGVATESGDMTTSRSLTPATTAGKTSAQGIDIDDDGDDDDDDEEEDFDDDNDIPGFYDDLEEVKMPPPPTTNRTGPRPRPSRGGRMKIVRRG